MKKTTLSREDSLLCRPVRNPLVASRTAQGNQLVLTVPLKRNLKTKLITAIFLVPKKREIMLDEIGRKVWENCDGRHTVSQLIDLLSQEYKLNRKEAEVSLIEYIRMLSNRGLVALEVSRKK